MAPQISDTSITLTLRKKHCKSEHVISQLAKELTGRGCNLNKVVAYGATLKTLDILLPAINKYDITQLELRNTLFEKDISVKKYQNLFAQVFKDKRNSVVIHGLRFENKNIVDSLFKAIEGCKTLKRLEIGRVMHYEDEAFFKNVFATYIAHNDSIEHLMLDVEGDIGFIFNMLKLNKRIKFLHLKANHVKYDFNEYLLRDISFSEDFVRLTKEITNMSDEIAGKQLRELLMRSMTDDIKSNFLNIMMNDNSTLQCVVGPGKIKVTRPTNNEQIESTSQQGCVIC